VARASTWITLLVLMNLIWAGSYTVIKYGLSSMDPLALVFWRLAIGFVALSAWILWRGYGVRLDLKDSLRIALSGLFIGGSSFMIVTGIEMSHATDASLLYVFEPVWAIILACIFLKERLRASTVVGLLIALAGLAWLSGFDIEGTGVGRGNVLIVVGLASESFFSITLAPVSKRRPASVVFAGVLLTACALLCVPLYLRGGLTPSVDSAGTFSIAYLAILCTALGYTTWVSVLRHVPLSVMEFTIFVQPITGMLIAAAFLGEALDGRVLGGGALCLAGMLVAVLGHVRQSTRTSQARLSEITAPADAL